MNTTLKKPESAMQENAISLENNHVCAFEQSLTKIFRNRIARVQKTGKFAKDTFVNHERLVRSLFKSFVFIYTNKSFESRLKIAGI